MYAELLAEARSLQSWIVERRRYFHRIPEVKFTEFKTQAFIMEELRDLGLEPRSLAGTGVVADLAGTSPGKLVALRADMDALPVEESTGLSFRSTVPGIMHACGHDGHMAMLLGAAKILSARPALPHGIRFIFQPAEEGGGGAAVMVEEGALENVGRIFGLHGWPSLSTGTIATRSGTIMAGADAFTISVTGRGGHAANPASTVDATAVAADIYNALHKLVTREVPTGAGAVLSLPMWKGSDSFNIIPEKVTLGGTLRTTDRGMRDVLLARIREIVKGYAKAWRCTGSVVLDARYYPPTVNDSDAVSYAKTVIPDLKEAELSMVSEDFSFYLEKVPGAFFFLGNSLAGKNPVFPLHHSQFDLDENSLPFGTALHAALALGETVLLQ